MIARQCSYILLLEKCLFLSTFIVHKKSSIIRVLSKIIWPMKTFLLHSKKTTTVFSHLHRGKVRQYLITEGGHASNNYWKGTRDYRIYHWKKLQLADSVSLKYVSIPVIKGGEYFSKHLSMIWSITLST